MFVAAAFLTAVLTTAPPRIPAWQPEASCLHLGPETREQRDRNLAALGAARAINSAQAASSSQNKKYAAREELAGYLDAARYNLQSGAEIVQGFSLTFDSTPKGYWFAISDQTDPCHFTYISNQSGVIFAAQPIR